MGTPTVPEYGWSVDKTPPSTRILTPRVLAIAAREGFAPPARVLDVGCGRGHLGALLIEAGYDVTGIDPSREGIELARELHPEGRWEQLEAGPTLPEILDTEPFDIVVSTEVVEHVYAPRLWAQGCLRCLRPGGLLICSTPYHGYLKNLAISIKGEWDRHASPMWDGGHIKLWSVRTLTRLLDTSGFERIGWEGVGRVPYLWRSMLMHGSRPADAHG